MTFPESPVATAKSWRRSRLARLRWTQPVGLSAEESLDQ
jgi:hypothetical protein